jgi:DNA-directed RNA polymerase subunit RPC12/RpoP
LEEPIVQKLPYRCPYCDQPVSYDQIDLKEGENEIRCPSCKEKYIKVVSGISPSPSFSPVKREGKRFHQGREEKSSSIKSKTIRKTRRR